MDILVLYTSFAPKTRQNTKDHLLSFRRYAGSHRFFYLDVQRPKDISRRVMATAFDGVIFHYTFLARRYDPPAWQRFYTAAAPRLKALQGYKVALPQDEYTHTAALWQLFGEVGMDHIFSIAREENFGTIFPPHIVGQGRVSPVLTGYIDPGSLKKLRRLRKKVPKRDIDIGYRARKIPFEVGRQGLLKYELVERFSEACAERPGLVANLSNTGNMGGTFLGDDWWRFILRCRTMPGCLGGSSLMDADGSYKQAGGAYLKQHPNASYEEIEAACFPGQDGKIRAFMLSPRHFECAMAKTCQVLVEGDYHGVFLPGVHYIELKRDFSNMDAVMDQIADHALCERIARRCFDDVVGDAGPDNPNTYRWFANHITGHIAAHRVPENTGGRRAGLGCRLGCLRARLGARLSLAAQFWLIRRYNAVSRFAQKRPALHAKLKALFKKDFEPLPL